MLNRAERNYCVTRKELLAVVASIEHFHYHLYGRTFKIRTDHSALQWLTHFKNPERQLVRWIQKLQQYDFQIEHRPGKSHQNADSLSRRPCLKSECKYCDKKEVKEVNANGDTSCWCQPARMVQIDQTDGSTENNNRTFTVEELKSAQMNDPDISRIVTEMEASSERPAWSSISPAGFTTKILWAQWDSLCLEHGVLYRKWEYPIGKSYIKQLILPKELREEVVKDLHCSPTSGHFGVNKTLARVKQRFYWPKCRDDVAQVCKSESRKP